MDQSSLAANPVEVRSSEGSGRTCRPCLSAYVPVPEEKLAKLKNRQSVAQHLRVQHDLPPLRCLQVDWVRHA